MSGRRKRQTTRWRNTYNGKDSTYIRVGRVFNSYQPVPEDVVRLQIKTVDDLHDLCFTMDEALIVATEFSGVVADEACKVGGKIDLRKPFQARHGRRRV